MLLAAPYDVPPVDPHSILEDDRVMPEQWFTPAVPETGPKRLLIAMLGDAFARLSKRNAAADEALAWFESDESLGFGAFLRICETLGLEPGHLRKGARAIYRGERKLGRFHLKAWQRPTEIG